MIGYFNDYSHRYGESVTLMKTGDIEEGVYRKNKIGKWIYTDKDGKETIKNYDEELNAHK